MPFFFAFSDYTPFTLQLATRSDIKLCDTNHYQLVELVDSHSTHGDSNRNHLAAISQSIFTWIKQRSKLNSNIQLRLLNYNQPHKRQHSCWKLSQELQWKMISYLAEYTHAQMASHKKELYQIEIRTYVLIMFEMVHETMIAKIF